MMIDWEKVGFLSVEIISAISTGIAANAANATNAANA